MKFQKKKIKYKNQQNLKNIKLKFEKKDEIEGNIEKKENYLNVEDNKKKEKNISQKERNKILNKDLEIIRYNKFMYEDSSDNDESMDEDEKTEDDLSPQKYDSDSEGELNKLAINQMDYFANINADRKKILLDKVNEYKENKKSEEIMSKNRKKIKNM